MESYTSYKKSRDRAWEILIRHKISALPVDVFKICKDSGVSIYTYDSGKDLINRFKLSSHTDNDGFSVKINSRYFIFYNSNIQPFGRIRFTIAHEMGHIALRHIRGNATLWNRGEDKTNDPREVQANIFASRLLAPACVLMELNIQTADDLQAVTGLSHTAAEIRLKRLNELRTRGKFYLSPLERQVYKNFEKYIDYFHYRK